MPILRRLLRAFMVAIMCMLLFAGCEWEADVGGTAGPNAETYFIFDTLVTVKIYDGQPTAAHFQEIEQIMKTIDKQMNRNREDSELSEVNRQSGKQAVAVSEQTFHVVRTALNYAASSKGKFDPTVGPLVDLWGIGKEGAKRPAQAAIDQTLGLISYEKVELNEAGRTIRLAMPGMELDLGAIAKGYAADRIAAYLKEAGFTSAIIDLGGNILAMGRKPGGELWSIGVQNPLEPRGAHIGIIKADNQTIVTSGIYERYFIENGEHYHHIMDPDRGYPVRNGLVGVTIVTDRSEDADALSTTLFSLGLEEGMRFVESRPNTDALFITDSNKVYVTSGLKGKLALTNEQFTLVP